jgi:tetratricopeptide (TPR) repeat protein
MQEALAHVDFEKEKKPGGDAYTVKMEFGKVVDDYSEAVRLDSGREPKLKPKIEKVNPIVKLTEAIHLDPTNADAFYSRGRALYLLWQDYDKAYSEFIGLIKLRPDLLPSPAKALSKLGDTRQLARKEWLDKVIADYAEAMRLEPIKYAKLKDEIEALKQKVK